MNTSIDFINNERRLTNEIHKHVANILSGEKINPINILRLHDLFDEFISKRKPVFKKYNFKDCVPEWMLEYMVKTNYRNGENLPYQEPSWYTELS